MDRIESKIEDKILKDIRSQRLKMFPKWIFTYSKVLKLVTISILYVSAVWFMNISIYKVSYHKSWLYLSYGQMGFQNFFHNFPFVLTVISILSIILMFNIFKQMDIYYKKYFPLLFISIIASIFSLAYGMNVKGINTFLEQKSNLHVLYHNGFTNPDWVIGNAIYRDQKGILIKFVDGRFFRAVPHSDNVILPIPAKNECIKAKGVITKEAVIDTFKFYKCAYKDNR